MKQFKIAHSSITLALLGITACSTFLTKTPEPSITTLTPPGTELHSPFNPGCLSMLDQYCDSLYSPGSEGNLVIHQKKGTPIYVLQGKTKNGLHQVFYELARSKIRNRDLLPKDFLKILKSHRYFDKLETLIHREPFEKMSMNDRVEANDLEYEVEHIWNTAIKDALIIRLTVYFPEFPQTPNELQSPEIVHFEKMERKTLLSEIANAIWKDHPNWKRVTSTFEKLRKKYLTVIERLPIDRSIRENWKERIAALSLALPGSIPEIVDQDCTSTTINAFYYTNYNVITVCAGDFNSEDILITLAHEMSHALDNDRSLYLFFKKSELSQKLSRINRQVCSEPHKPLSCADWQEFKDDSSDDLEMLSKFNPTLLELNRCLKKEPTHHTLDAEAIQRIAVQSVRERVRKLADEEAFIRLIEHKLPLPNGKRVNNPSYLNPCHYLQSNWNTEDLDGELSFLTAFTAEYQCSKIKDPSERLHKALTYTSSLFEEIESEMIASEGEFSERKALVDEDFSSPPSERFADYMGSLVVAEYLSDTQAIWDRRMTFLSGNSWQCTGPSLSTAFPKESAVLRKYLLDSHTDGEDRKKEIFSTPVRASLSCEKDFEWNECSIFSLPEKP
jgi:hypothetical protein